MEFAVTVSTYFADGPLWRRSLTKLPIFFNLQQEDFDVHKMPQQPLELPMQRKYICTSHYPSVKIIKVVAMR
jgi:hypothetical protein